MAEFVITAASHISGDDLKSERMGKRFRRLDLTSRLALLAVKLLGIDFGKYPRDRVAICLASNAGSLSTDVIFWEGRGAVGGPPPKLFAYTLPSAAIGEIAIHYRLTGPNLCLVGGNKDLLHEAVDMLRRREAEACVCVFCDVISTAAAKMIHATPSASACAFYLRIGGEGLHYSAEIDCNPERLCAKFRAGQP